MLNLKVIKYSMTLIIVFMMASSVPLTAVNAASPATLKLGSSNADVPDIQFRLKSIGYFQEQVSTYFGIKTLDSLKRFQRDYGLTVDGIAGERTWAKLKKVSVNQTELDLLARIIYAEARGESYKGQVAVGAVVMNRLNSSDFPDTIKGVIEQPRAFTAVDDGQYNLKPNKQAYLAAQDAVKGYDPTGNALYYFNPDTATSKWIWTRKQIIKIDKHIFAV